jgi:hypothetical protein
MKTPFLIVALTFFVLSACTYDAPLVEQASLPIDPALLGSWTIVSDDAADKTSDERVLVRRADGHHYAIEHIDAESVIYFTAWLAELEGIRFLQLEVTGDDEGPVGHDESNLYSVFAYAVEGEELVVRSLNTQRVSEELDNTAALQEAFATHRNDPELFHEPARFRKL